MNRQKFIEPIASGFVARAVHPLIPEYGAFSACGRTKVEAADALWNDLRESRGADWQDFWNNHTIETANIYSCPSCGGPVTNPSPDSEAPCQTCGLGLDR